MTHPSEHDVRADAALRRSLDDFTRAASGDEHAAALPAAAGLVRALLGVARFAIALLREAGAPDPIHERPRILQPV